MVAVIGIILFVTELVRSDIVALGILTVLATTQVISIEHALSGFSNPATMTVLALFVLSEAVSKTGLLDIIKEVLLRYTGESMRKFTILMMVSAGFMSMWINNTAIVALSIPIVIDICNEKNWSATKILLPLSFASMFGGVCTLIGTSTNILANEILVKNNINPFAMFDFFQEGVIFFVVGLIYLFFYQKYIPARKTGRDLEAQYNTRPYIFIIKVLEGASLIGKDLDYIQSNSNINFEVLSNAKKDFNGLIAAGDKLKVRSDIDTIMELQNSEKFEIMTQNGMNINPSEDKKELVEAVISPESKLDGVKLKQSDFFREYKAKIIAMRQRKGIVHKKLENATLRAGDTLLLLTNSEQKPALEETRNFIFFETAARSAQKRKKIPIIIGILAFVVLSASLGYLPIVVSALLGIMVVISFDILSMNDVYRAINWQVIFLLAGLLALGEALVQSGGAQIIASHITELLSQQHPSIVFGVFYALSCTLTAFMSNNASVAILTPIGIFSAQSLGINEKDLLLPIMFGASMSIFTPIGYQTNVMIYNIGQYEFRDFFRAGFPLTIIFILLSITIF